MTGLQHNAGDAGVAGMQPSEVHPCTIWLPHSADIVPPPSSVLRLRRIIPGAGERRRHVVVAVDGRGVHPVDFAHARLSEAVPRIAGVAADVQFVFATMPAGTNTYMPSIMAYRAEVFNLNFLRGQKTFFPQPGATAIFRHASKPLRRSV